MISETFAILLLAALGSSLAMNVFQGLAKSRVASILNARIRELERDLKAADAGIDYDYLTGTYNRRFIMRALDAEKARSDRNEKSFSVCIIDLDGFRHINDRYGHKGGDEILRGFARYANEQLRDPDILATGADATSSFGRFGGEEFLLMLPETDLEGATICADRLREANRGLEVEPYSDLNLTFSAGVAEYQRGENIDAVLKRADHALFAAKKAGRDQVVSYSPELA